MVDKITIVGQVGQVKFNLIPVSDASVVLGYTPRYVRMLAERGEIIATKIGRQWYVYPQLIKTVPLSALLADS